MKKDLEYVKKKSKEQNRFYSCCDCDKRIDPDTLWCPTCKKFDKMKYMKYKLDDDITCNLETIYVKEKED